MVLYFTVSTYHILRSMLHKLNYHPDEEAILLIPPSFPKTPFGLTNKNDSFFKEVIKYDWEYKRYDNYPEEVFSEIRNTLNDRIGEKWETKISEYNVFYAARFLGSFLVSNKIEINWFEEADGRYLNPYPTMEDDKRLYPKRFELAKSLGLYTAENEFVRNIYISLSANKGVESNLSIIDFDINNELRKVSDDNTEKLLNFWCVKRKMIDIDEHSALLMSQHCCNIGVISFEEQVLLYQMTVDYFLMGYKLYLKRHPSDLFPYKEFINDIIPLDADYPSELLQYSCSGTFEVVAAVSSTGIMNLCNISNRQLLLNEDYITGFKENDLYYFACTMLNTFSEYEAIAIGVNDKQLKVMAEYGYNLNAKIDFEMEIENKYLRNKIIILGSKYNENALVNFDRQICNENIIIFLDNNGTLVEHKFLSENKISVKRIKTYSIRTNEEIAEKKVFIVSNNKRILERVNSMEYEKLLSNTKIKVRVDSNADKDVQISTLTGMLDETEKTLENCVEENRRLRAMLEQYNINPKSLI